MNEIRHNPAFEGVAREVLGREKGAQRLSCYEINDYIAIIDIMASITIRNLEGATKRKLKIRAAMNGRSMEQEAREILKSALAQTPKKKADVAERIREIFGPLGGVEVERLPQDTLRDPDWLAAKD
jgi:plasmid stability protein